MSVTLALLVLVAMAQPEAQPSVQPVEVDMRNVTLHITETIVLHVTRLRGRFLGNGVIPYLDDKNTYTVEIDSGEIAMDMASLNALLNEHVLGHGRSNLENVKVSVKDGQLEQKGQLDKGIDLPFKVKGEVEATPDGRIRVHTTKIRGAGLPVKGLMKLFGIEMDDLVKVEAGHGVEADGNDLILDPEKMLPPPRISGHVSAVRLEGDRIVQTFSSDRESAPLPGSISKNHIFWQGGRLRFGKLTMEKTDLELVDMDPKDAFDFSVDHWNEQLVAGFSKNKPDRGLKSHMPDYGDVKKPAAARP